MRMGDMGIDGAPGTTRADVAAPPNPSEQTPSALHQGETSTKPVWYVIIYHYGTECIGYDALFLVLDFLDNSFEVQVSSVNY